MTKQEAIDNIVREVLRHVSQYDEAVLGWDAMAERVRRDVDRYVEEFFTSNSIDIEEVDLFGPNDDGYAVDEDIDEDEE